MTKSKKNGILLTLICISMIIWGMSWSSAKVMGRYGDALTIAFVRFGVVVFMLLPAVRLFKLSYKIERSGWKYLLSASLFLGLYTTAFFRGLQLGNAGAAGVLVTTLNPLFAFLIGVVVSKVVPKKQALVGLFIGLLGGAFLLELWDNFDAVFQTGNLLFIAAAFLWAVLSKITSLSKFYAHPITFSFWLHLVVPIGMLPFVNFDDVLHLFEIADATFYWNLAYFGIINSSFATVTYLVATTIIGAEKASTFIFLVPISAILTSYFTLGESIEGHTVIGMVLGVSAVVIINKTNE
jgi:drug/metabolite transporter (DMT)-like permease